MTKGELREAISQLVQSYADIEFSEKIFLAGETNIPPSGKLIDGEELKFMVDAALDGWLTTGRFNDQFETRLAEFIGVNHLITVNSGSSANLVAFSCLTSPQLGEKAIKPGDEVIGVAAGFPTTVNPAMQFGAVPVFVDVDPETHNIDVDLLEAALSSKTRAVMLAHTLGNPFNLGAVRAFCDKHDLWLVEDCCDALGATFDERKVGTWGDVGTLSFYPAHHITMGEGGAVFTNDPELKRIAESFRDWGRDCYCPPGKDNTCGNRFGQTFAGMPPGYDHKYIYAHCGYNLKITDMQAACGLAQLDKLDSFIASRRKNFSLLLERLSSLNEVFEFTKATPKSDPSWFGFPVTLKESAGIKRVDLLRYLDENKIGTRLLFAGNLTKQPYFSGANYRVATPLPNTDRTMRQTFWLGVQPALSEPHIDYVGDTLEEFFGLGF